MDIIDIISKKEFSQLSSSERDEVLAFAQSEEEYNSIREVFISTSFLKEETIVPSEWVKKDLDSIFYEQYARTTPVWYLSVVHAVVPKDKAFHQQPLVRIAAIVVLAILVVPFFRNDDGAEPVKMAQVRSVEKKNKANDLLVEKDEVVNKEPSAYAQIDEISVTSVDEISTRFATASESFDTDTENLLESEIGSPAAEAVPTGFNHPDGIFAGAASEDVALISIERAMAVSRQPDVLDLLTATF